MTESFLHIHVLTDEIRQLETTTDDDDFVNEVSMCLELNCMILFLTELIVCLTKLIPLFAFTATFI